MSDPIRLYLDEDTISRALIQALRARNVDVFTAQEADRIGFSDLAQLTYAASLNRVIFTFNTRDYVQLHKAYVHEGRYHAGIIVSDQIHVGIILRRLLRLLDAKSATTMQNWLEFLGNWR